MSRIVPCRRKRTNGRGKKAQSTLELTLSLMVLVILFLGALKIMHWAIESVVKRHNAYMDTKKGNFPATSDEDKPDFYTPSRISLVPDIPNINAEKFSDRKD